MFYIWISPWMCPVWFNREMNEKNMKNRKETDFVIRLNIRTSINSNTNWVPFSYISNLWCQNSVRLQFTIRYLFSSAAFSSFADQVPVSFSFYTWFEYNLVNLGFSKWWWQNSIWLFFYFTIRYLFSSAVFFICCLLN